MFLFLFKSNYTVGFGDDYQDYDGYCDEYYADPEYIMELFCKLINFEADICNLCIERENFKLFC